MAEKVLDRKAVGLILGVAGRTIAAYQARYADTHPFPAPAGTVGRSPYWTPDQVEAIKTWNQARPGQGTGGGRPPKGEASE